jgi:uncharacterized protein
MIGFIRRHAVAAYAVLAIAISWTAVVIVVGPAALFGTADTVAAAGPLVLLGPPIAGLGLTALLDGRQGLAALGRRLVRWRVGWQWYAVALLTAPVVTVAVLAVLSQTSSVFVPAIVTTDDKLGLVLTGVVIGLFGPFLEEIGWTGFATPRLRATHGTVASGLVLGVIWGLWHFPLFAGSADPDGIVPSAVLVAVLLFSWLPPYRVLMTWVHDHTNSVLVATLMHAPITALQFILATDASSGTDIVLKVAIPGLVYWVMALAIAWTEHGAVTRGRPTEVTA